MVLLLKSAVAMEQLFLVFVCACLMMYPWAGSGWDFPVPPPSMGSPVWGHVSVFLLVVLLILGVGRVGSLVHVPGFPFK